MHKSEKMKVKVTITSDVSNETFNLPAIPLAHKIRIPPGLNPKAVLSTLGFITLGVGKGFYTTLSTIGKLIGTGWTLYKQSRPISAPFRSTNEIMDKPRHILAKHIKEVNSKLLRQGKGIRDTRKSLKFKSITGASKYGLDEFYKTVYMQALALMGEKVALKWLDSVESYSEEDIEATVKTLVDAY